MRLICLFMGVIVAMYSSQTLSNTHTETYGNIPYVTDMKISPNGKKIAYLQDSNGKYVLIHKDLSGASEQHAINVSKGHIRSFIWINDGYIALSRSIPAYSPGDYEQFTIWRTSILNLKTNEFIEPFDSMSYRYNIQAASVVSTLPKEPLHILMSNYKDNRTLLYKINLENGDKQIIENEKQGTTWIVNPTGHILLYRSYDQKHRKYVFKYKNLKSGDYQTLMVKNKEGDEAFPYKINGFDETGQYIYFIKRNISKLKTGYRAEINDGYVENIKVISQSKAVDLNHFTESEYVSSLIVGANFTNDYEFTDYFDKKLAQVQADFAATFLSADVLITSYDTKKQMFIVKISGASYGIEYYLYDTRKGAISLLANAYPKHEAHPTSNVESYDFTASDGTNLKGYLTLPYLKELPPLIVLPHGGPEARDDLAFYWIRQFFAANGFAVLQVNFRGSSGYGKDFANAGYGEWGNKMQTDLDDGVAQLIADNLIDKEKICIVGASYGGYAALIGATKKPEIYKCAVSYAGISSLSNVYTHEKRTSGSEAYWTKSIGDRFDKNFLELNSPANLVNDKTSPILLIHGDKDTVVPLKQSRRMYKALKEANHKPRAVIVVEGADHWFTESNERALFLEESYKFVSKHLGV